MKNKSLFTKIALAILILLLATYSCVATYFLVVNREKGIENNESEEVKDETKENEKDEEKNTSDNKIKEYTHPNYPDMVIKYDDSWKLDVKEKEEEFFPVDSEGNWDYDNTEKYTSLTITLEKDNTKLRVITWMPMIMGWEGSNLYQYEKDKIVLDAISPTMYRFHKDSEFTYLDNECITFKNDPGFDQILEFEGIPNNGFDIAVSPVCEDITFETQYSSQAVASYDAFVTIYGEINGNKDDDLLDEIDSLILNSTF